MPAISAHCASAIAVNGVSSAGLMTTVHPAANAAPALRVIIANGKFQGVIKDATPTGCLICITSLLCAMLPTTSP
uniref:Uncharacterized protein n=1 Tax=Panstrongylus lignarius TaxID=156445 RepID=A0A224XX72_9HEMI